MARIRSIKPEFWQDEKLSCLSPIDRLVFLGLISQADDAGRIVDNVKLIDGLIFPSTDDSSRESLDTLARLSRITRYASESGQRLIQIANWAEHQKVDKPSKYVLPAEPSPNGNKSLPVNGLSDSSQQALETLATDSRDTRDRLARRSRSDLGPTTTDLSDLPLNGSSLDPDLVGNKDPDLLDPGNTTKEPTPADLMMIWNQETTEPIPRCRALSDQRRKRAKARLRDASLEEWRDVIRRIELTAFCRGENDRGWMASFDWLLQEDTRLRVLEGKYGAPKSRNYGAKDQEPGCPFTWHCSECGELHTTLIRDAVRVSGKRPCLKPVPGYIDRGKLFGSSRNGPDEVYPGVIEPRESYNAWAIEWKLQTR